MKNIAISFCTQLFKLLSVNEKGFNKFPKEECGAIYLCTYTHKQQCGKIS